jgi:NAD(P)-dependent dehydrogenase (short-subunit alcohol dehydrogenase family)
MNKKLSGKVALITGGTSGIGLATAKRFVNEGAHVYVVGRRRAELDRAVAELGAQATGVQADVSKQADLDALVSTIKAAGHRLDVVFANAGGGGFAPLGSITPEQFDKEFNINVKGVLFTVQTALPLLNDGGSIVLNASTAASQGMPAFSVYAATKAAVRSFARGWTTDLKERRIRVNAVSPGVVPTNSYQTELGLTPAQVDDFARQMTAQIPLGRVGNPDEIAKAVLFLASDESSFISGIELTVDGGMTQV